MNRSYMLKTAVPAVLLGACASLIAFDATASGRMAGTLQAPPSKGAVSVPRVAPGSAQEWVYVGPEVATVGRIAVSPQDPDRLMAALEQARDYPQGHAMYLSDDAGLRWRSDRELAPQAYDGVFDPEGRMLVASFSGIHESIDGGANWTLHTPDAGNPPGFLQMAMRRDGTGDVWARGDELGVHRVFRADQPGFTAWHDLTPDINPNFKLQSLAVSDTHAGTVAVAGSNSLAGTTRVWISTDNGTTWTERGSDLPSTRVADMHFHDGRLLVALAGHFASVPTGVFASDDLGQEWIQLWGGVGYASSVNQIGLDPDQPGNLWIATEYEGLHRSTDGGQTWTTSVGNTSGIRAAAVHFDSNGGRLWLGVDREGLWLSTDGGDSFTPRDHMMNPMPVKAIGSNPLDPAELAVGAESRISADGRVLSSLDGGLAWSMEEHPYSHVAGSVRFDRQGRLFATLSGSWSTGLMRREPSGHWVDVGFAWAPTQFGTVEDVHFGAADDTLILAGALYDYSSGVNAPALWRSNDDGDQWELVHTGDPEATDFAQLLRLETPAGLKLVALQKMLWDGPGKLVASTDDGLSWGPVTGGLPAFHHGAMCAHGAEMISVVVVVDDQNQLWRSFDAGNTWIATAWAPGPAYADGSPYVALHCGVDPDVLLVGGNDGVLLRSTDGGNSFQAFDAGLEDMNGTITAFHATSAGLYMGTTMGTWFHPDFALPVPAPTGLSVDLGGGRMRTLVDLAWTGGAAQVDVRRDGVRVATVANNGHYRTSVLAFQDAGGMDWQVCNEGTSDCATPVPTRR